MKWNGGVLGHFYSLWRLNWAGHSKYMKNLLSLKKYPITPLSTPHLLFTGKSVEHFLWKLTQSVSQSISQGVPLSLRRNHFLYAFCNFLSLAMWLQAAPKYRIKSSHHLVLGRSQGLLCDSGCPPVVLVPIYTYARNIFSSEVSSRNSEWAFLLKTRVPLWSSGSTLDSSIPLWGKFVFFFLPH